MLSAPVRGRPVTTRHRIVASLAVLGVVWALAFNATSLPFFVIVVVGGILTGLAGLWVRARADEPCPPFRMSGRDAALAVVVAALHYLVGRAAFAVAAALLPAMAATATSVYGRTGGVALGLQVVLGAAITAPLEEVFWRGAVHPHVSAAGRRRFGGYLVPFALSVAVYATWHVVTWQVAIVAAALLGGIVWGWVVDRTGSLGAAMLAHGTWTALMLLAPVV